MPQRKSRQNKPEGDWTHLNIRVESFEASAEASINHDAYSPQFAFVLDEDDPVYKFTGRVRVSGISTDPPNRAHDSYEIELLGDASHSHRLNARLKDLQKRDEKGVLQYRQYRGRQVPVFEQPRGLGLLEKVRGECAWRAFLLVTPKFVDQWIVLLQNSTSLFMSITEFKLGRARWVRSVTLGTTDPAEG
jgi:hypothetical protein